MIAGQGASEAFVEQVPHLRPMCACLMGIRPSLYWYSFGRMAGRRADIIASAMESLILVRTIGSARRSSTTPARSATDLRYN